MRKIQRKIVSALIWSKDNKLLMGKKDRTKGGVYPDCWHIPGGGVKKRETFKKAIKREVLEEVGIDISKYRLVPIPYIGAGVSEKIIKETKEKILCKMEFNYFEVHINDKLADEIKLRLNDDLIKVKWFTKKELPNVKQIPGGKKFFRKIGYIKKD